MKNTKRLIAGLFFVWCFCFLYFFNQYHLYFEEQMQLFLWAKNSFFSYIHKPAFLSSFIGDFITQFYLFKGLGPLLITIILFFYWLLFKKIAYSIFKVQNFFFLSFIPVAIVTSLLFLYFIFYYIRNILSSIFYLFYSIYPIVKYYMAENNRHCVFAICVLFDWWICFCLCSVYSLV